LRGGDTTSIRGGFYPSKPNKSTRSVKNNPLGK
jgi:hypothetical protein